MAPVALCCCEPTASIVKQHPAFCSAACTPPPGHLTRNVRSTAVLCKPLQALLSWSPAGTDSSVVLPFCMCHCHACLEAILSWPLHLKSVLWTLCNVPGYLPQACVRSVGDVWGWALCRELYLDSYDSLPANFSSDCMCNCSHCLAGSCLLTATTPPQASVCMTRSTA